MTSLDNSLYRMGRDKRGGSVGFMVETIPFIGLVALIASVVFGISMAYYDYDISVRDSEARLLAIAVDKCLMSEGVLDLDKINERDVNKIASYCGIDVNERLYVGVKVVDSSGKEVGFLSEGDSGLAWARDLILSGYAVSGIDSENIDKIAKYNPGHFEFNHFVVIISGESRFDGKILVEASVGND